MEETVAAIQGAGATIGPNYLAGQKTPVGIVGLFIGTNGSAPTLEQTNHDFWQLIASGAKGILVYSHYHASDQNGMLLPNLQVLGQAAGQLNAGDNSSSLATAILNGQPVSGVTASVTSGPAQTVSFTPTGTTTPVQYPSIHVWAQQFSNRTYLIAVNSTDQSVSAQVAGLPVASGTANAPAESRSLPISGGAFRDRDRRRRQHRDTTMPANSITMYGTTWCQDCKRAKKFFGEHRVAYDFVDVDQDADGLRIVEQTNAGKRSIPTIFFADGSVLVEPSNADLASKLGLQTRPDCPFYDVVVVGGGPAGLTAAVYAARDGLDTLVVEEGGFGGQAGVTERLDNYPGFPEGIGGGEFADRLVAQARRYGVELLSAEAGSIEVDGQYRVVRLTAGGDVRSYAVLVAPGSTYQRLGVPGEDNFIGAGVHFCATCDGPFYRGQDVLVVGGGNSATEEAVFLTKFARHVTIVTRDSQLTASQVAREDVLQHPQIDIRYGTTVEEFRGTDKLESVVLRDLNTGKTEELHPAAVFLFIGLQPNTGFLRGLLTLNEAGFVVTSATLETSMPGVFAAGDGRAGSTKQLVSAAGEGATAALMIRAYLRSGSEAGPAAREVERDGPGLM